MLKEMEIIDGIKKESQLIDSDLIAKEVLEWIINNVENFIDNSSKIFKLDLVLEGKEGMTETKKLQDLYRAIPDDKLEGMPLSSENVEKHMEIEKISDECSKCRRILDAIVEKSHNKMVESKSELEKLFARMIFYYEKIIPNPENKIMAKKIDEDLKKLIKEKEEIPSYISDEERSEMENTMQNKIVEKIKQGEELIKFEKLVGIASIPKFEYEAFEVGVQLTSAPFKDELDHEEEVMKKYTIPEGFTCWVEINYRHSKKPTAIF